MRFEFKYVENGYEVTLKTNECEMFEVIKSFESFLKGCGYVLKDGELDIKYSEDSIQASVDELVEENIRLKQIVEKTLSFARNYADLKDNYIPREVNLALMEAEELELELDGSADRPYARHAVLGEWDSERKSFKGTPHFWDSVNDEEKGNE